MKPSGMDGEKVATAEEYAAQATAIADTGRAAMPPAEEEWKPLGVFGQVQGEDTVAKPSGRTSSSGPSGSKSRVETSADFELRMKFDF